MPHSDMRVKQNKARLGEPGRGIIQFETLRRHVGESLLLRKKGRMCVDIAHSNWMHNRPIVVLVSKQHDYSGKTGMNGTK